MAWHVPDSPFEHDGVLFADPTNLDVPDSDVETKALSRRLMWVMRKGRRTVHFLGVTTTERRRSEPPRKAARASSFGK